MSKKQKKNKIATEEGKIPFNTYRQVRRTWGAINPVTRVVQGKKVYKRKNKYTDKYLNGVDGLEDF